MAGKTNSNRKRILRTAILSASMLSMIPLVGAMRSEASTSKGATGSDDGGVFAAAMPATTTASAQAGTAAVASAPAATSNTAAATTASSTSVKQTTSTTQASSSASYTRTKAS